MQKPRSCDTVFVFKVFLSLSQHSQAPQSPSNQTCALLGSPSEFSAGSTLASFRSQSLKNLGAQSKFTFLMTITLVLQADQKLPFDFMIFKTNQNFRIQTFEQISSFNQWREIRFYSDTALSTNTIN